MPYLKSRIIHISLLQPTFRRGFFVKISLSKTLIEKLQIFMKKQPLEICILRLSAIGDVCHTLAVVQAIQRQYPDAHITWKGCQM